MSKGPRSANVAVVQPANLHDTKAFAYSHATRMGDLIFVAGQVPFDQSGNLVGKGDIRAQVVQVFANLKAVLEAAGSGLDKVGKVTVFTTDIGYRPVIHEIRSKVFAEAGILPASTLAVVTSLANPDWLVEIEAVALAGE
jgi:enamine deaminase RidA (YjgF/YER057c/UK114 family)